MLGPLRCSQIYLIPTVTQIMFRQRTFLSGTYNCIHFCAFFFLTTNFQEKSWYIDLNWFIINPGSIKSSVKVWWQSISFPKIKRNILNVYEKHFFPVTRLNFAQSVHNKSLSSLCDLYSKTDIVFSFLALDYAKIPL